MSKVPYSSYPELDEFYPVDALCKLFRMEKAELRQKCEKYGVKPRRNEIGQYGFVKYDVRKLHNLLYHEDRSGGDHAHPWEDDPWK